MVPAGAIWFTGLSGAGKTTVSQLVAKKLDKEQKTPISVELLDGDILRKMVNQHLGFSKEDRFLQIKYAAFISNLLIKHGIWVLASFITPYRNMREYCRKEIPNYIEVYVQCPLEECITRDTKGLYRQALSGQINYFTGISDPYEEPENAELVLDTMKETPEESASRVIDFLRKHRCFTYI
jgi:adenylylsulfate kinase